MQFGYEAIDLFFEWFAVVFNFFCANVAAGCEHEAVLGYARDRFCLAEAGDVLIGRKIRYSPV